MQRYAAHFDGVEINSSFHRPHRRSTWLRWAESVPDHFRFSAKIPKTISHGRKLVHADDELTRFLDEVGGLGSKLAILLLQLPPSLAYEAAVASRFLEGLIGRTNAQIVCEPRHASWFEPPADVRLLELGVTRVAADPAKVPAAAEPGGWRGLTYLRLHGSPDIYRSAYGEERLRTYAERVTCERANGRETWCIFDNTAASAGLGDAMTMKGLAVDRDAAAEKDVQPPTAELPALLRQLA